MTPEFKAYQMQVLANCKALSSALIDHDYKIVTGKITSQSVIVYTVTALSYDHALLLKLSLFCDHAGGSDNHLILLDLRSKGTDGGRAEKVLEACAIACNKNTCPGSVLQLFQLHFIFSHAHNIITMKN